MGGGSGDQVPIDRAGEERSGFEKNMAQGLVDSYRNLFNQTLTSTQEVRKAAADGVRSLDR